MSNETPSMAKVLQDVLENRLCNLHTAMPGRVISYDPGTQKAKIQPQFKRKFRDGTIENAPTINDVPVIMPRTSQAFISLPIKEGDQVLLVFAERSLDTWKQKGGEVDTSTESRKHDLSDAFALPGAFDFTKSFEGSADNILIQNGSSQLVISPNGTFKIQKKGGDELLDLLSQVVNLLATTTTNTMIGPQKLNAFAQFEQLKTKIDKLKG